MHQTCQAIGKRKLDKSFLKSRIEVLTRFDELDEAGKVVKDSDGNTRTYLRWCGGEIQEISDGTWLIPNARTRCYKENEAAIIDWDEVKEVNIAASRGLVELPENKWNKDCEGAWRKDLGDEDYGL